MITWQIEELNLELNFSWRLSRGESDLKKNYLIRCQLDDIEGVGEVAPNIRFGESSELIVGSFESFKDEMKELQLDSLESLTLFFEQSTQEVPNSLRFGIESAYLDLLGKVSEKDISELLGTRSKQGLSTSFSVPIMDPELWASFYEGYNLKRFERLKLKIENTQSSRELADLVMKTHSGGISFDANEGFSDIESVVSFFEGLELERIDFLEQPFPADKSSLGRELKKKLPLLLMADESLTSGQVIDDFALDFHAINIKLMKSGSFIKAKRQVHQARNLGLKVMLGCMIETSVGISYALAMGANFDWLDLDGFLLIKDEPFQRLYEDQGRLYRDQSH